MKRTLLAFVIFASFASAAGAQYAPSGDDVPNLWAVPRQAPPMQLQSPPVATRDSTVYPRAYAEAVRLRRPLVIFVGVKVRGLGGAVCCQMDELNGNAEPRIVIAFPGYGELRSGWNLDAEASDEEIRLALKHSREGVQALQIPSPFSLNPGFPELRDFTRGEVGRQAIPFSLGVPRAALKAGPWAARQAADVDFNGYGSWPASVEKPEGLVRYRRAEYTQEIAQTSVDGGVTFPDRITPVHRSNLAAKWHQSGGMEEVAGFRSDVYKFVPEGGSVWIGNIAVWNGSNFQANRGWKRSYPDGTRFFDSLSKDDVVFEHRERSKSNSKWTSKVVYSDHAARPSGYAGLTQSCASCHDEAGSGGYAVGLVPGGDTVLSDPFEALEQSP